MAINLLIGVVIYRVQNTANKLGDLFDFLFRAMYFRVVFVGLIIPEWLIKAFGWIAILF